MIHLAGAGPEPVPYKSLTAKNLAEGITYCLTQEVKVAAKTIFNKVKYKNGVKTAVRSICANLPLENIRCDIW